MGHVSHKLTGSLQGALAGGGAPATSPLYVFGPFLKLVLAAGVAHVTFGASIWLAVLTVVTVSAMYRLVMGWVTDGSGGSGLSRGAARPTHRFGGEVVLLSVLEGTDSDDYPRRLRTYLEAIAVGLRSRGVLVRVRVEGAGAAQTIVRVAEEEAADLLMMVSHGLGGVERQSHVKLGSVADQVLHDTPCPVLLVSALPVVASVRSRLEPAPAAA